MQAGCGRIQKMRVRQAGVGNPGVLEFNRLEAQAGPPLLEAFANRLETLIDAKIRDEQRNRISHAGHLPWRAYVREAGRRLRSARRRRVSDRPQQSAPGGAESCVRRSAAARRGCASRTPPGW